VDKKRFIDLLRHTSLEVSVSLTESQLELFWLYLQELMEWNKTFNLTSIKEPADIIIKHFVDSLTPLPYLERAGRLLDIGSGAGFPGIPLKIGAPQLQIHIVDARRKKTSFLKHLIRTLELKGVTALHGRAEEMAKPKQPFQIIISRAFRRLEPMVQLVSPLMQPGNTFIAMLGPTKETEQERFKHLALAENLKLSIIVSLELPRGRGRRTLVFFTKI
jgi:16S rRNA (guanine527-N7)-methyltransferase